ncbi:hypothetical protein Fot_14033 [Forsythia ovata]|uniref:Uncharacterized protein n=1 Tax=Forsythia ovata TaxID=205694 RepID=A0ABD1W562_9LAMI
MTVPPVVLLLFIRCQPPHWQPSQQLKRSIRGTWGLVEVMSLSIWRVTAKGTPIRYHFHTKLYPPILQTNSHILSIEATSQEESDAKSQPGSKSEEPSGESQHTEHIEELKKSGSYFAIDNEEENESSDVEDNDFNDEHDASVLFTCAQKDKQKVDEHSIECSIIVDLPAEHWQPSPAIPTPTTHHQLFKQSLFHKGNNVFTHLNYKSRTLDAQAQFHNLDLNLISRSQSTTTGGDVSGGEGSGGGFSIVGANLVVEVVE